MSNSKKENSISLIKFLNTYYGINKVSSKIKHSDVKVLFPYIKRTSYKNIDKNMEKYYDGEIIYVYDVTGNCIPYINPKLMFEEQEEREEEQIINLFYEEEFELGENIENLDLFELIELKKKCLLYGKTIEFHRVCKQIRGKIDYASKRYKNKKEKVKIKERREYYDQY